MTSTMDKVSRNQPRGESNQAAPGYHNLSLGDTHSTSIYGMPKIKISGLSETKAIAVVPNHYLSG
jgi:hypothetical protein